MVYLILGTACWSSAAVRPPERSQQGQCWWSFVRIDNNIAVLRVAHLHLVKQWPRGASTAMTHRSNATRNPRTNQSVICGSFSSDTDPPVLAGLAVKIQAADDNSCSDDKLIIVVEASAGLEPTTDRVRGDVKHSGSKLAGALTALLRNYG